MRLISFAGRTLSPRAEGPSGDFVAELATLFARQLLALLRRQQALVLVHLLFVFLHPGDVRQQIT